MDDMPLKGNDQNQEMFIDEENAIKNKQVIKKR